MEKVIYLDHASTTPTDPEVVAAMVPWLTEEFGNPSTVYSLGLTAPGGPEARESIARTHRRRARRDLLHQRGHRVRQLGHQGRGRRPAEEGPPPHHLHHRAPRGAGDHGVPGEARLRGHRVPVDGGGLVDPEDVRKAIRPDTILVSIMHANNEVGTIEPIAEIGKITREAGVLFHTDAVQTAGKMPLDVNELGVDMLSMSAHKFYGPKGVGLMYLRKRARVTPLFHGGGQERGRRAGTHNVPGIVGMAKALELAGGRMAEEPSREAGAARPAVGGPERQHRGHLPERRLERRLPNNLNFRLEGIEGEAMILMLDMKGICVSSGSACTTGSLEPSHVLLALGIPAELAHGSLRVTLGRNTTAEHIDHFIKVFPPIVARLREMSPIWCANCICKQRN